MPIKLGASDVTLKLGSVDVAAYLGSVAVSAFDPLSISGLVGWYDSADLSSMAQNADGSGAVAVGDQVGYWADKSTTGAHLIQAIAANRPTLTAAAVNGNAALVFDGNNDNLSSASYTAQSGIAGLTRVAVYSTSQNSQMTRALNSSDSCFFVANDDFVCRVSASAGDAVEASPANQMPLRVYANVFDGGAGTCETFFNNALQATKASPYITAALPATTPGGSATLHVGSNAGSNNFVAGPVAEYLVYASVLTASELTAVYNYLASKWGI